MRSRILVVGRDVTVRARLARLLRAAGYGVEFAESTVHVRRIDRKGIALAIQGNRIWNLLDRAVRMLPG
jgi:hypothetical protein